MKRLLLSTALTLALAGTAALAAQQPDQQPTAPQNAPAANAPMHRHHHHPNPQRQAAMLSRHLNLTPDQTARLEPIFAERDQKFHALMQDQSLTPEQRHEQFRTIHQSTQQQLASVLTPDQLQQMKAMRHNHRRFQGPNQPNQPDQQPQAPGPPSGL
jgi:Spy/CpxP family protein refolding chaperone